MYLRQSFTNPTSISSRLQGTHRVRVVDLRLSYRQDVSQDQIPIMLVGNKTDLRQEALRDGNTCISTSHGERLAMVRVQFCSVLLYSYATKDTSRNVKQSGQIL